MPLICLPLVDLYIYIYRASGKGKNAPTNKKGLLPLWLKPWVYCRYGLSPIMTMTMTMTMTTYLKADIKRMSMRMREVAGEGCNVAPMDAQLEPNPPPHGGNYVFLFQMMVPSQLSRRTLVTGCHCHRGRRERGLGTGAPPHLPPTSV